MVQRKEVVTMPWRADNQLADAVQHTTGLSWWAQLGAILVGIAGFRFARKHISR